MTHPNSSGASVPFCALEWEKCEHDPVFLQKNAGRQWNHEETSITEQGTLLTQ